MMASRGRVISPPGDSNLYLQLLDGTSLSFHAGQESYDKTEFASLEVNLALADMKTVASGKPRPRDMYLGPLLAARRRLLDVGDRALEETIEINRKLIMPVAALILALFGVPLGIQKTRTVRARGFAVSLVVILGYYLLFSGSITIARGNTAPSVLIMWLPNLIFAVGAVLLTNRAARDRLQYPPMASWPRLLRRRAKGNAGS
ncbi:MAG: LptF/LptG family permease, partial [bacterium]